MAEPVDGIIDVGLTFSSTTKGCTACKRPMFATFNPLRGKLSTGKPDAGNPPVWFGGRGGRNQSVVPTPINTTVIDSPVLTLSRLITVWKYWAFFRGPWRSSVTSSK